MKYLIINADDFGLSKVFNTKILELAKNNLISSVSVMVNRINGEQDDQVQELAVLKALNNISVGLHFEFKDSNFKLETEKQFERFFTIFGFNPDHIDLHKSTYLKEAYPLIAQFCQEKSIPCRNYNLDFVEAVKTTNEVINGTEMSFDELKKEIDNFKDNKSYEIFFHPGVYDPNCKSSLNKEREEDARKIEGINQFLEKNNIKLISHIDLV